MQLNIGPVNGLDATGQDSISLQDPLKGGFSGGSVVGSIINGMGVNPGDREQKPSMRRAKTEFGAFDDIERLYW